MRPQHHPALTSKAEAGLTDRLARPAWQVEHERTVHEVCVWIKAGLAQGKNLRRLVQIASTRWNGKSFRYDPARRLALTPGTIMRYWYQWRKGGELPCAVRLRYALAKPVVPAPVLIRFVNLCAAVPFPNILAAWEEFTRRNGSSGRGGRSKRAPKFTIYRVLRYFTRAQFRQLQAEQQAITTAQHRLAALRLQFAAEIRARVPDRIKQPRRTAADQSLYSAAL